MIYIHYGNKMVCNYEPYLMIHTIHGTGLFVDAVFLEPWRMKFPCYCVPAACQLIANRTNHGEHDIFMHGLLSILPLSLSGATFHASGFSRRALAPKTFLPLLRLALDRE